MTGEFPLSWRAVFLILMALGSGAIFFAIGHGVLGVDHPAGDAYILFRYVENVVGGHGIVFNVGGPRAEGATDFLWFALLIGAVSRGVDVSVAALALNACGAAIAAGLLARACWGDAARPAWVRAALCAVPLVGLFSGGALAAYSGFSSMLYSALILLLFVVAVEGKGRALLAIPILGLCVAFFRPDGVIIAAAFVLLGLWPARENRLVSAYMGISAACALVGLIYFAWRWNYFGLLLPLPLYVKQHGAHSDGSGWAALLPGLSYHWSWILDGRGPLPIGVVSAGALVYGLRAHGAELKRTLVFLLPLACLLVELAFAVQSQNLHWRFQAPVHLVLSYLLLVVCGRVIDSTRRSGVRALVVAAALAAVMPSGVRGYTVVRQILDAGGRTYLEAYAPRFGPQMGAETVIALTETGILPYWTPAHVADIVGLTNPDTARQPPTLHYLQDLDPDLVFYHQARTLNSDKLGALDSERSGAVHLSAQQLREALDPSHQRFLQRDAESYEEAGLQSVEYAAIALTRLLSESAAYDIFAVDFTLDGRYSHIYGLKRDWPLREKALAELKLSLQPENYWSYFEGKRRTQGGE